MSNQEQPAEQNGKEREQPEWKLSTGRKYITEDMTNAEFSSGGDIVCLAPETAASFEHWPRRAELILQAPKLAAEVSRLSETIARLEAENRTLKDTNDEYWRDMQSFKASMESASSALSESQATIARLEGALDLADEAFGGIAVLLDKLGEASTVPSNEEKNIRTMSEFAGARVDKYKAARAALSPKQSDT